MTYSMDSTVRILRVAGRRPRAGMRALGEWIFSAGLSCARTLATWIDRARQRQALADLDDRMLNDIGITRSEARREAAKPFWRCGGAH
jgi:uncharacterized protein YjiS (DUF1127 family)